MYYSNLFLEFIVFTLVLRSYAISNARTYQNLKTDYLKWS